MAHMRSQALCSTMTPSARNFLRPPDEAKELQAQGVGAVHATGRGLGADVRRSVWDDQWLMTPPKTNNCPQRRGRPVKKRADHGLIFSAKKDDLDQKVRQPSDPKRVHVLRQPPHMAGLIRRSVKHRMNIGWFSTKEDE